MQDGVQDGLWRRFYENGQAEFEGRFERGKEEGLFKRWRLDGTREAEGPTSRPDGRRVDLASPNA
jgi:antitoxin component YwqK of YwqJK toxin-antitoxin module